MFELILYLYEQIIPPDAAVKCYLCNRQNIIKQIDVYERKKFIIFGSHAFGQRYGYNTHYRCADTWFAQSYGHRE